jgi:N-carbamoylputrescine amidase
VRRVGIGVAQLTTQADVVANRNMTVEAAASLFSAGADVVVLPELIVPGYSLEREFLEDLAEPIEGPTVCAWQKVAAAAGGYIAGGFCERQDRLLFDSAVIVGPDGVLLHYRKLHLFAGEKRIFTPGNLGLPVVATEFGVLGLCICYDLRFVETARALALRGAEIICVPTAWLPGFDAQLWDNDGYCPQARSALVQANLDQVFIACASQAGASDKFQFLGSSLVCGPFGSAHLGPLPGDTNEVALALVDLEDVVDSHERGQQITPRADRRDDVYALYLDGAPL